MKSFWQSKALVLNEHGTEFLFHRRKPSQNQIPTDRRLLFLLYRHQEQSNLKCLCAQSRKDSNKEHQPIVIKIYIKWRINFHVTEVYGFKKCFSLASDVKSPHDMETEVLYRTRQLTISWGICFKGISLPLKSPQCFQQWQSF